MGLLAEVKVRRDGVFQQMDEAVAAKTSNGVQRKERRKLSGIISSRTAASMKPAPRATK